MQAIKKAYTRIKSIESAADLKKYHLTLSDYDCIYYMFNDLNKPGKKQLTVIEAAAMFYKSCGYKVVLKDYGFYEISI